MKYSYLGLGIIMAGLFGIVFIVMFQSITVNNEAEYYVLKEAMEASMLESIDLACFRNSEVGGCDGNVKISEQKFVENFTRRFAASISGDVQEYEIQFYDIIESPPKASVVINGLTEEYKLVSGDDGSGFSITNSLSGILEHKKFKNDDSFGDYANINDIVVSAPDGNSSEPDNRDYRVDVDFEEFIF